MLRDGLETSPLVGWLVYDNSGVVMEYITLPGTNLRVSRICLGTQQFANSWEWPMDHAPATATVVAALDVGINFFDTAEAYGVDGDRSSEHMLGVALQGRRHEAVIATKFGFHAGENQRVYDGEMVTAAIEESLSALQTDYIDLFQIHWPGNIGFLETDTAGQWPKAAAGVVEALERAVEAGKIKYYGWCNFGTEDMLAFKAAGGRSVSNQLPYNLLWRAIECGILPACITENVGVLCYSPLAQALLTGKYVNSKMVPEGRRRSRLFAHDSTPTSRHGGRGLEDELFSPGAPAPDGNDRYGSTNQKDLPLELQTGMYPGYGAIGALQAICDGTFVAPVISY